MTGTLLVSSQKFRFLSQLWLGVFFFTSSLLFGQTNNCNPNSPYDKIVSSYHQSVALKSDGTYSIWGQQIASNGSSDVLAPDELGNFPIFANKTIQKPPSVVRVDRVRSKSSHLLKEEMRM